LYNPSHGGSCSKLIISRLAAEDPNGYPDLLLLDIWMSGWNGRDICIFLKSQEVTQHLPIVLVSANRDTEKIARDAGADDFMTKPFNLDELVEKIEKYI
jgi:DNA-binding response OmpR family regulator